jgi:hypothetical protein
MFDFFSQFHHVFIGTTRKEVELKIEPTHLCVKLSWHGRFLDGPLRRRVKGKESVWCLTGEDDAKQYTVLHVMMVSSMSRCKL